MVTASRPAQTGNDMTRMATSQLVAIPLAGPCANDERPERVQAQFVGSEFRGPQRRLPKQAPCEATRRDQLMRCGFVRRSLIAVLLHGNVDEFVRRTTGFQEIPALHPLV